MILKSSEDEGLFLNQLSIKVRTSDLIDHINNNTTLYEILWLETSELVNLSRTDGINLDHLNTINEERLIEPIIISRLGEETWVIDGNHRLLKRHNNGLRTTPVINLPEEVLSKYTEPFSLW